MQLRHLAGQATLYTALGDDEVGHRAADELLRLGLRVEATFRPEPQRRGFVFLDDHGERTITVIGERLGPSGADPLPWDLRASYVFQSVSGFPILANYVVTSALAAPSLGRNFSAGASGTSDVALTPLTVVDIPAARSSWLKPL